jgi:hypothetical protein
MEFSSVQYATKHVTLCSFLEIEPRPANLVSVPNELSRVTVGNQDYTLNEVGNKLRCLGASFDPECLFLLIPCLWT